MSEPSYLEQLQHLQSHSGFMVLILANFARRACSDLQTIAHPKNFQNRATLEDGGQVFDSDVSSNRGDSFTAAAVTRLLKALWQDTSRRVLIATLADPASGRPAKRVCSSRKTAFAGRRGLSQMQASHNEFVKKHIRGIYFLYGSAFPISDLAQLLPARKS